MIIDFCTHAAIHEPTNISKQFTWTYRQLLMPGNSFRLKTNILWELWGTCQKVHLWLFCLRRLPCFNNDKTTLSLINCACIESVLSFCLVSYSGSISQKSQVIKSASKIIGESQMNLQDIYCVQLWCKTSEILFSSFDFKFHHSGQHFAVPKMRTKCNKNVIVPAAITLNIA